MTRSGFARLLPLSVLFSATLWGCAIDASAEPDEVVANRVRLELCPPLATVSPTPTPTAPPRERAGTCTPDLVAKGEAKLDAAYAALFNELKCRNVPARSAETGAACLSVSDAVFRALAQVTPPGWMCTREGRDGPFINHYAVVCKTIAPLPPREVLYDYWTDTGPAPTFGRSPTAFRIQYPVLIGTDPPAVTRCDGFTTNPVAYRDVFENIRFGVPVVNALTDLDFKPVSSLPQNASTRLILRVDGIDFVYGRYHATGVRFGAPGSPSTNLVFRRVGAAGEPPPSEVLLPVQEVPARGDTRLSTMRYYVDLNSSVTRAPGTYLVSFDNCYSRKHPVRLVVQPFPERAEQWTCSCRDRAYNPITGSYWTDGDRKLTEIPPGADPSLWHLVTAGSFGEPITCTAHLATQGGGCNCAGGYGSSTTHTGGDKGYSGVASACECVPPRDGSYVCPPAP